MTVAPHTPLHIAVCDDEPLDRQQITALTKEILQNENIPCTISTYSSGSELLSAIRDGAVFSILLLDVVMEGINGMELAAALRKQEDQTMIIFISINREMALRGYEVEALRYLAKPVNRERLQEALLFCCRTRFAQKGIPLPTAKGQCRISLSEIVYAEASERITRLFLANGPEELRMKISTLESILPKPQFVLCHRSYLVNLAFVKYLRPNELELITGDVLPVSKYRISGLRQQFLQFLND